MKRLIAKNGWTLGLVALLIALFIFTRLIQPGFGASGLESLSRATLPFAFATAAMAVPSRCESAPPPARDERSLGQRKAVCGARTQ